MTARAWSYSDLQILRGLYPDTANTEIAEMLGRSLASVKNQAQLLGLKKAPGYQNPGRFKEGDESWNKGKRFDAGGRSAETRFKKGRKPHSWRPVGHQRVTKDGYWQRKVTDTGYTPRDYRFVHHLIWEEAGREIPDGYALCFRNGDRSDLRLENLELVRRSDLIRRHSLHNYPDEVRQLIQLRGALTRKINSRSRGHEEQDG